MGDDVVVDAEPSSVECHSGQMNRTWKREMDQHQSKIEALQDKLTEVQACMQSCEDEKKEIELLWKRVKTTATLLTYLKLKARVMAVPHLAHASCGIKHQEGVGLVDKHGTPLSGWLKDIDLSSFGGSDEETCLGISDRHSSSDGNDGAYIGEVLKSVQLVTDVMESLVKQVIMAEAEAASEKEKVSQGQEEIRKKVIQIECMSAKVEEMEKFAQGTNSILNEMRQKVEDMVQETTRQRQRAAENEQELCRVKQDFASLRSYVDGLINVRETLLSSEKQFHTMENLFERLIAKTNHLEGEKMQKEAEVQKLMEENLRLSALLDNKEAQLLAMNEQCKFMALNSPDD
ncbi:hypothetical protein QJS10_CPA01g02353 [Acorus calamus]|uniref:Uncharacterized protein n=1 Tax=Acorus calamus TaxID=4465 RepID=A0AAV9FJJ7_ACOCL|nr:hypothetical protein QJS10_CPA01g02353 [Acorus calamus]